MPRPKVYLVTCSKCGNEYPKTNIMVKRCQFKEFGKGGRILRSRDIAYFCVPCVQEDPDYQRPAYAGLTGEVTHVA